MTDNCSIYLTYMYSANAYDLDSHPSPKQIAFLSDSVWDWDRDRDWDIDSTFGPALVLCYQGREKKMTWSFFTIFKSSKKFHFDYL